MSSRLLLLLLPLLGWCSASYVLQPDVDQCDRPQCAPIDEILVANVDPDVEPCGNFYGFACAKGLGELERDFMARGARTSSSVSPADPRRAADRVIYDFTDLRKILDEPLQDDDPDVGDLNVDSLRVERQIYEICKRGVHTRQERLHYEQLLARNQANRLEANVQYDPLQAEQQHWSRTDLRYALGGFGFAFFEVDVIERRQPFVHVKRYLQLRPTADNVLDLNDLLTAKYMKHELDRRPIYDHHPNNNDPNFVPPLKKYSDIKDFIREFNKIVPYDNNEEVNERRPEPKTIENWQRIYNEYSHDPLSKINWLNIFKELLGKISVNVYDHDLIIIKHENYFFRLAELLKLTRDVNTIVNYIHLRFVSKTIGFVEKEYESKYAVIPPVKGLACTPGLLVGAAHVYVQRHFPKDNKETVEAMFGSIKNLIDKQLSEEYNLQDGSELTRNYLRQLGRAEAVIGYPDWLANRTIASKFYGRPFPISQLYFANQLKFVEILLRNKLRALYEYDVPIFDMNTFYKSFMLERIEFSRNLRQIVLPARLFSETSYKFLSAQLFDPINYGAAGATIASELYLLWLNRISYAQNATKCIAAQVPKNSYKLKHEEFVQRFTAYLLGLQTAYRAWPTKDSYPIQFRNFGTLTDFRLFFLSFAESMCRAQLQSNEIPPQYFIDYAVDNMIEFKQAFGCNFTKNRNRTSTKYEVCHPLIYD
ncbi:endothelin-converting enzyme 1-like [Trichogramma pretiosum]|uniref:endothelin-converting enzyme 1-like n=1 Tax=Trichogramma pretiosum TaxID=7493 RepID=UPI0006C9A089|nr:endothelin-converting enzyme 1-like [Trichogramma pretiosum]